MSPAEIDSTQKLQLNQDKNKFNHGFFEQIIWQKCFFRDYI
jgi:hypothetical protein